MLRLSITMIVLIENESQRVKLGFNTMKIRERLNIERIGSQFMNYILKK